MQDAQTGSSVYVGNDVAKHSFDVAVLPSQQQASLAYDDAGSVVKIWLRIDESL